MIQKPSGTEEEYFARESYEKKRALLEEQHRTMAAQEKKRLKELHHMRCPKCGMELVEIDYRNLKVDKCTDCSGVWLDPGELEQVATLEKSGLDRFFSAFKK